MLLRLSDKEQQVEKVWHRREEDVGEDKALHCLMSTPYIAGEHIYGADSEGMLRCLRLDSGEQIWQDESAVPRNRWATIHMVRNGDRTWLFNERGELIIGKLNPQGFQEISRAKLIDPTTDQLRRRDGVTWSHPAFAYPARVCAERQGTGLCRPKPGSRITATAGEAGPAATVNVRRKRQISKPLASTHHVADPTKTLSDTVLP